MKTDTKYLLYLVVLAVLDVVIPLPLTAGLLLYVVLSRPDWFRRAVSEIYSR